MSVNSKQWFGLPLNLIWGYIAIAVFMTGAKIPYSPLTDTRKSYRSRPKTAIAMAFPISAWVGVSSHSPL